MAAITSTVAGGSATRFTETISGLGSWKVTNFNVPAANG